MKQVLAGESLIQQLIGDGRNRQMIEDQIQDDFKDGYIEGHRGFAANEGRKQAFKDIIESKKPGFFRRGVMKAMEKPQGMNLKANNTFADKRQKLIQKIESTSNRFKNVSEKKLRFRV